MGRPREFPLQLILNAQRIMQITFRQRIISKYLGLREFIAEPVLSLDGRQVHQSQFGWSPVFISDSLSVMSVGFLLPSPDHPIIWRGPRKNALIRQLLSEVCWNDDDSEELDFLLIDTPPGTSDEHLSAVQYLQAAHCLDGAIIVTTPQEVALSDVRKVTIKLIHATLVMLP